MTLRAFIIKLTDFLENKYFGWVDLKTYEILSLIVDFKILYEGYIS